MEMKRAISWAMRRLSECKSDWDRQAVLTVLYLQAKHPVDCEAAKRKLDEGYERLWQAVKYGKAFDDVIEKIEGGKCNPT